MIILASFFVHTKIYQGDRMHALGCHQQCCGFTYKGGGYPKARYLIMHLTRHKSGNLSPCGTLVFSNIEVFSTLGRIKTVHCSGGLSVLQGDTINTVMDI